MAANRENKGRFTKGDPRINRKGRPRSFDALRELAQQIAHEEARMGDKTLVINGHTVTVVEAILRQWAASRNPQLQKAFVEIAFGKVPDVHEIPGLTEAMLPMAEIVSALRQAEAEDDMERGDG